MAGLGTGFGPLVARRLLGDEHHRMLLGITISFFMLSTGLITLAFSPNLWVFSIITFMRTIGAGTLWVLSAALLQTIVPDNIRGRVFAFEFAFLTAAQSISILVAGIAQDSWGFTVWNQFFYLGLLGIGISIIWMFFQIKVGQRPLTQSKI